MLTGGQVADCEAAKQLLELLPAADVLHGDKGYDTDLIRRRVEANGTLPNIPPKANRDLEELLLARPLSRPQRHRAHVLSPEGLPAYRHALRPARHQLSRRRLHRRNCQLLVISPTYEEAPLQ